MPTVAAEGGGAPDLGVADAEIEADSGKHFNRWGQSPIIMKNISISSNRCPQQKMTTNMHIPVVKRIAAGGNPYTTPKTAGGNQKTIQSLSFIQILTLQSLENISITAGGNLRAIWEQSGGNLEAIWYNLEQFLEISTFQSLLGAI